MDVAQKVLRLADETPSRLGANLRSSVLAAMQLVHGKRHSITLELFAALTISIVIVTKNNGLNTHSSLSVILEEPTMSSVLSQLFET